MPLPPQRSQLRREKPSQFGQASWPWPWHAEHKFAGSTLVAGTPEFLPLPEHRTHVIHPRPLHCGHSTSPLPLQLKHLPEAS